MPRNIDSLISGIPSMGSYAGVIAELEAVINDPNSTLATVGATIEKDPDLTARLLRLGNSSFYGFPSRLETVAEAISLIGIQQVQDLIIATKVISIFAGIEAELVNMESFWKHSLACGVGARSLAIAKRLPKTETYFVAGLLHDVGRLVLYSQAPTTSTEIFKVYQNHTGLLRDAETEVLGFDHAQIGEQLLRSWKFPASLIHAVGYHHHPLSASIFQIEASLVHAADYVIHAMEIGSSGERFVPPLDKKAWERLNLGIDSLESVIRTVDEQIDSVIRAFLTPSPSPSP